MAYTKIPSRAERAIQFFTYRPTMKRYTIVETKHDLKKLRKKMMAVEEFAFDTETNTLRVYGPQKDFALVGISISWGEYHNYYIPVGHKRYEDYGRQLELETVSKYLKEPFEREDVRIIGQNIKFDMHVMARINVNIKTRDLFDTMIASWLCDENSPNGLKENSAFYLGLSQTHFKEVTDLVSKEVMKEFGLKSNSRVTFDLTLIDDAAPYALADSFNTWELYLGFLLKLEDENMDKIFFKVYAPFIRTLFEMEERGVVIDTKRLNQMSEEINKDLNELEYKLIEIAGVEFKVSSNAQLAELLFGYVAPSKEQKLEKQTKAVQKMFAERDHEGLEAKKLCIQKNDKGRDALFKIVGNPELQEACFHFKPLSTTAGGAPQVNADVLWKISHLEYKKNRRKKEGVEFCKLLADYKKLEKLRSAFIDGMIEQIYDDGKAHPTFNIIGTDSGRISCSKPNLQQLPKAEEEDKYQIRSLFIGSLYLFNEKTKKVVGDYTEGDEVPDNCIVKRKKIVALDFSNLEMRVLTHFSKDKNLLTMFLNGDDAHGSTAVNMFELPCTPAEAKKLYPHLRQAAKILNFLLMYGGGAFRLYEALKGDHFSPIDLGDKSYLETYKKQGAKNGEDVAQIYIDKYFDTYSGVAEFIKKQKRFAHKNGYVKTILGRKRRLPDINSHDFKTVAYCERLSVNSKVQGSAADITMSAQNRVSIDLWYVLHFVYMILQVHDELVFESPEEYVDDCISKTQRYMSHPFGDNVELNVPMLAEADFGNSYQEAK